MKFERITSSVHPLYAEAINLYKVSFPYHEQREEKSQSMILANTSYHFDIVSDNDNFIGEILYWDIGNFRYIEHFCVEPSMRNHHYGQKIIESLQNKPLILEIDPPLDAISKRRKGFYERCGFVENPYSHTHPPYHENNSGHKLIVMSYPKILTPLEYKIFFQELQNTVMKNVVSNHS